MKKRKTIGVITALPESIHVHRILEGVFEQCKKYDYNVAVFAPTTQVCFIDKTYLRGELNIYELINFDLLDGIIVDVHSLGEDNIEEFVDYMNEKLKKECHVPVVALGKPMGDYPCIKIDDRSAFRKITEHFLDVHGCRNIYFLTGTEGNEIAEARMGAFKEVMEERGIPLKPHQLIYGDFWYSGGSMLGDRIVSGELELPEAVICASDHLAIGLANRLKEHGIKIPEDILISGYEATQEAAINDISISSFEASQAKISAEAVDYIAEIISPEVEITPLSVDNEARFHPGMSCGCASEHINFSKRFKETFYSLFRNFDLKTIFDNIDIGQLMEGYVPERLTQSDSPETCLDSIYQLTYFLRPYNRFYMCLREDWLYADNHSDNGYPEKMNIVVHTSPEWGTGYHGNNSFHAFETKLMLPDMFEETKEPVVFYFSPIHFQDNTFGYSVVECLLSVDKKINLVHRNWLRYVNTSLEMLRAKNRLLTLSIHDEMTGAYNRRGLEMKVSEMLESAGTEDKLLVCVVDMDGLKYINDNFGHTDGDFGIKKVCDAAMSVTASNEICVRAGGDEFFIIGVGDYTDGVVSQKLDGLYRYLETNEEVLSKPYKITASFGSEISEITEGLNLSKVINAADAKMYRHKYDRKKQRR